MRVQKYIGENENHPSFVFFFSLPSFFFSFSFVLLSNIFFSSVRAYIQSRGGKGSFGKNGKSTLICPLYLCLI